MLTTLDTAPDFLDYLKKRQALLCRPQTVISSSEEDLLGLFMTSFDEQTENRDFPASPDAVEVPGTRWAE